jgi:leucyl/phenylalanyl-tRNA---protein transferase
MLFMLNDDLVFPPVHLSEPDGLLALGGDLRTDRLLLAYRNGIFPWYQESEILWWCPDPRFVLFPSEFRISPQTEKMLLDQDYQFTVNKDFAAVIRHCKEISRPGQNGTWITDEVEQAYTSLHQQGIAVSAELWNGNELTGGLYGIRLGNVFFGESMFSKKPGYSRMAFTLYMEQLKKEGVQLIDCQVYTSYLAGFGARMIPRAEFLTLLKKWIP